MTLNWPNQKMNCTLSEANQFVKDAAAAGFTGGVLTVNTMATLPGEIVNMEPVDSNGQPTGSAIPGWPSGNYLAAFCVKIPSQGDAFRWLNIGLCIDEIENQHKTIADVLALPAGETGAIGKA